MAGISREHLSRIESGNSAFSFSYRQENQIDGTYNIVDNPEKFTLEMEWLHT